MTGEVNLEKSIRADRAVLFRACSSREGLEGWYADRVRGTLARGGAVRLEWPALGAGLDLEVLEFVPERRIVFGNGSSRVVLSVADGVLRLEHHGLSPGDDTRGLTSSWRVALALLAHGLEAHPGQPRKPHWHVRRARATPELAHLCFTEPEALSRWLGASGPLRPESATFAAHLASGRRLSGRVLAHTEGGDVGLSLAELDQSFLALRTFPGAAPSGRLVALCWSSWATPPADERAFDTELKEVTDRLSALLAQGGAS